MKKALVLSGGGAKGAYQIGVIKALNKLKMKYDIVVGCSIGSINACMYAMNSYHKSKRLWMKIKNSDIFTMPDNLSTNDMYLYLVKMFIKNKGLSFDQAEKFLRKQISEKKIRKSKIDFGIVTYSLNKRQPKMLRKDEIPEGKIIDYVVASSTCFPFIKTKKIGSDSYIDGGFYDNIPIDLAQKMGAEQVLAVDLSVLAIDRPVSDKKIKVDHETLPKTRR